MVMPVNVKANPNPPKKLQRSKSSGNPLFVKRPKQPCPSNKEGPCLCNPKLLKKIKPQACYPRVPKH